MGWAYWLLLFVLAAAALLALAAWLVRFRYSYAYVFPARTEGRVSLAFLAWRKELVFPVAGDREEEGGAGKEPEVSRTAEPPLGERLPHSGQAGFLAVPWEARLVRFRIRLKAAARKWVLDLPVWGHMAAYLLGTGWRALRLAGPSLESLHVGGSDIRLMGRFAAVWSSLGGLLPFLAGPVEYGFNERPFALRLRLSGGCTALGALGFLITLAFTLPWLRLGRRFLYCYRHPRLNRWQRRLMAAMG